MFLGATLKANRPVTSHAVVQPLDVLDEVTEELQCRESTEEASSMDEVHEIVKEFQEPPSMTKDMLPARGVFCQ